MDFQDADVYTHGPVHNSWIATRRPPGGIGFLAAAKKKCGPMRKAKKKAKK